MSVQISFDESELKLKAGVATYLDDSKDDGRYVECKEHQAAAYQVPYPRDWTFFAVLACTARDALLDCDVTAQLTALCLVVHTELCHVFTCSSTSRPLRCIKFIILFIHLCLFIRLFIITVPVPTLGNEYGKPFYPYTAIWRKKPSSVFCLSEPIFYRASIEH